MYVCWQIFIFCRVQFNPPLNFFKLIKSEQRKLKSFKNFFLRDLNSCGQISSSSTAKAISILCCI